MWSNSSTFYQIYPFGFCGAPDYNDGLTVDRIRHVEDFIPHLKSIGIDALYFSPVFQSDRHGYDTQDYFHLDSRLGTNADFSRVCAHLRESGIRVVLDGVFNHVGRGFWAFRDVLTNREASPYKDWFYIDFSGNTPCNDGFRYEGWEGHYDLVKLNLSNPDVINHLFAAIRLWVDEFGIDGLRLDVAYCLDREFLKKLRRFCETLKPDFLLIGEVLFGDYRDLVNPEMLHSCTNYECFKGIHSSLNDLNLFEINYSLNRQFGNKGTGIYKDLNLLTFCDNHDVVRLASILKDPRHLPLAYGLLFTMPGTPCLYYGSEWGAIGEKSHQDDSGLRPYFNEPVWNDLTGWIRELVQIKKNSPALQCGAYRNLVVKNKQLLFEREAYGERLLIAVNIDSSDACLPMASQGEDVIDLLSGNRLFLQQNLLLPSYSFNVWRIV